MQAFHDTVTTINEVRDNLANFDDFFRPLRNYFYWEPHCFDIPSCAALRSVFDSLDGISALSDQFGKITASLDKLNALQPQLVALIAAADRHPGSAIAICCSRTTPPPAAPTPRARRR